jgi:hypothetical protein
MSDYRLIQRRLRSAGRAALKLSIKGCSRLLSPTHLVRSTVLLTAFGLVAACGAESGATPTFCNEQSNPDQCYQQVLEQSARHSVQTDWPPTAPYDGDRLKLVADGTAYPVTLSISAALPPSAAIAISAHSKTTVATPHLTGHVHVIFRAIPAMEFAIDPGTGTLDAATGTVTEDRQLLSDTPTAFSWSVTPKTTGTEVQGKLSTYVYAYVSGAAAPYQVYPDQSAVGNPDPQSIIVAPTRLDSLLVPAEDFAGHARSVVPNFLTLSSILSAVGGIWFFTNRLRQDGWLVALKQTILHFLNRDSQVTAKQPSPLVVPRAPGGKTPPGSGLPNKGVKNRRR